MPVAGIRRESRGRRFCRDPVARQQMVQSVRPWPREVRHFAIDTRDRRSDRPTAQPWAARGTTSAGGRGLLMPVDRYEATYGSGRVEHALRRDSASRDRPTAIQPPHMPMTGRVRIRSEPRPAPLSCLQTCCRPRSSTPLLPRPEDSRALPSAGAGCPSARTRLPSRLPRIPVRRRRGGPSLPCHWVIGADGTLPGYARAVAQTAAARARARTPVSRRQGGYPA